MLKYNAEPVRDPQLSIIYKMAEHDFQKYPELTTSQLAQFGFTSPHPQITEDFFATVVKVTDGDTIRLTTDFRDFDFPLRFLDIDAPEMNAGGAFTKEWLINKIMGQPVQILIDQDNRVDKWGRLLGRVFYSGLDIGQEELHLGLAKEYQYRNESKFPNIQKEFNIKQWL